MQFRLYRRNYAPFWSGEQWSDHAANSFNETHLSFNFFSCVRDAAFCWKVHQLHDADRIVEKDCTPRLVWTNEKGRRSRGLQRGALSLPFEPRGGSLYWNWLTTRFLQTVQGCAALVSIAWSPGIPRALYETRASLSSRSLFAQVVKDRLKLRPTRVQIPLRGCSVLHHRPATREKERKLIANDRATCSRMSRVLTTLYDEANSYCFNNCKRIVEC